MALNELMEFEEMPLVEGSFVTAIVGSQRVICEVKHVSWWLEPLLEILSYLWPQKYSFPLASWLMQQGVDLEEVDRFEVKEADSHGGNRRAE